LCNFYFGESTEIPSPLPKGGTRCQVQILDIIKAMVKKQPSKFLHLGKEISHIQIITSLETRRSWKASYQTHGIEEEQ